MKFSHCFALTLLFCLNSIEVFSVQASAIQPDVQEIRDRGTQHYEQLQTDSVKLELNRLKDQFGLTDEWQRELESSLSQEIEATAKRLMENSSNASRLTYAPVIDRVLQRSLWSKVKETLTKDQLEEFARYRKEVSDKSDIVDDIGIRGLLVCLDQHLCLSQQQIAELQPLFEMSWQSSFNSLASSAGINGPMGARGIFDVIGKDALKTILDTEQYSAFLELGHNSNLLMALQLSVVGPVRNRLTSEKVRSLCDDVMDRKVAEYESLVGWTDRQRKLFVVARKGAVLRVAKEWEMLIKQFTDDSDAAMNDPTFQERAMMPLVQQCTEQSAWKKMLAKIFDEEQMARINERENARAQYSSQQRLDYLVLSVTSNLDLSAEQHQKMVSRVRQEIEASKTGFFDYYEGILTVPDEDYQEMLSKEQWKALSPLLQSQRASWEEPTDSDSKDGGVTR